MNKIQSSIFILLLCSFSVFSQENDFQAWYSLSFNKKIVKKTTLHLKLGSRFRENSSIYSKQFFDLKAKRKINKNQSLASGYRYANNWDKQFDISNIHRFYADFIYKSKIVKRLSFSIRNRLQYQGSLNDYTPTFRQKLSLSYNIKKTKLAPSIASEYFLRLDNGINKLRSTIQFSYPITKKIDFDIAYRIEQEFTSNNPETLFIFEGRISYNL